MNEKQLRAELDAVYSSLSWRITAPLRHLSAFVRRYLLRPLSPRVWLRMLVQFILRRPRLLGLIKSMLSKVPALRSRLQRLSHQALTATQTEYVAPQLEEIESNSRKLPSLNANAVLIYRELQQAIKRKA